MYFRYIGFSTKQELQSRNNIQKYMTFKSIKQSYIQITLYQ